MRNPGLKEGNCHINLFFGNFVKECVKLSETLHS